MKNGPLEDVVPIMKKRAYFIAMLVCQRVFFQVSCTIKTMNKLSKLQVLQNHCAF